MDTTAYLVQHEVEQQRKATRALRARERYAQEKATRIANGEQVRGPGRPKVYLTEEERLNAQRRRKRVYMQKKRAAAPPQEV